MLRSTIVSVLLLGTVLLVSPTVHSQETVVSIGLDSLKVHDDDDPVDADEPYLVIVGFRFNTSHFTETLEVWPITDGHNNLGRTGDDWASEDYNGAYDLPPEYRHMVEEVFPSDESGWVLGAIVVHFEEDHWDSFMTADSLAEVGREMFLKHESIVQDDFDSFFYDVVTAVTNPDDLGGAHLVLSTVNGSDVRVFEGPATRATSVALQELTDIQELTDELASSPSPERLLEILAELNEKTRILKPVQETHAFTWRYPVNEIRDTAPHGSEFGGDHEFCGTVRVTQIPANSPSSGAGNATLQHCLPGTWNLAFGQHFGRLYVYRLPGLGPDAYPQGRRMDSGLGLFYPLGASGELDRTKKQWVRLCWLEDSYVSMELCELDNLGSADRQKEKVGLYYFREDDGPDMMTGFQYNLRPTTRLGQYRAGAYARKGGFLTTPKRNATNPRSSYEDYAGRWKYVRDGCTRIMRISPKHSDVPFFRGLVSTYLEAWGDNLDIDYDVWWSFDETSGDPHHQHFLRVKDMPDTFSMTRNYESFAQTLHHQDWLRGEFGLVVDCEPAIIAGTGGAGTGCYYHQVDRYVPPEPVSMVMHNNPYEEFDEFAPVPPRLRGTVLMQDSNGAWQPVLNAVATITPSAGGEPATIPSNHEGNFVATLRKGTWRVQARKGQLVSASETVMLDEGEQHVTLRLAEASSLAGMLGGLRVVLPSEEDSTLPWKGRALPDLPAVIPHEVRPSRDIDATGNVPDLPHLIPGEREHTVQATNKDQMTVRGHASEKIALTRIASPSPAEEGDATLSSNPNAIREVVVRQVRGHVVVTANGGPDRYNAVQGARLEWFDTRQKRRDTAVSQSGGRFSVQVPHGTYLVRVSAPRGYQDRNATIEVRPGMPAPRIVLAREAKPDRRLTIVSRPAVAGDSGGRGGHINRSSHGEDRQNWEGIPERPAHLLVHVLSTGGERGELALSGATVAISQNGRSVAMHQTRANGSVTAKLPSPGSYQVSVSRAGYQRSTKMVSVRGSSQETFYLRSSKPPVSPASLTVRVLSTGGEFGKLALSGSKVVVSRNGRTVVTRQTGSSGSVTVKLPSPGSYQVSVTRVGYQRSTKRVSVSSNTRTEFTLTATSSYSPTKKRPSMGIPKKNSDTKPFRKVQPTKKLPLRGPF